MTAVMSEIDFDINLDEMFDSAIKCDGPECDEEAEWRVVISCCNRAFLICDGHKVTLLQGIEAHIHIKNVTCVYCKSPVVLSQWIKRLYPI